MRRTVGALLFGFLLAAGLQPAVRAAISRWELVQALHLIMRAGGAAKAADDVLTWQGPNQIEWKPTSGGWIDHGTLAGLGDDDHSQYALLDGRAPRQTLHGGNAASDDLVLNSTSDATKGTVYLARDGGNVEGGDNGQFEIEAGAAADTLVVDTNSRVGINTAAPSYELDVYDATGASWIRVITGAASNAGIAYEGPNQKWFTYVRDGSSDEWVLYNGTDTETPIIIMPGGGNNQLYLNASGHVIVDGTSTTTPTGAANNTEFDVKGPAYATEVNLEKVRVREAGNTAIADSTHTYVTFDTEDFDIGACHSTLANTSRLTAPVDGYYMIGAEALWENNAIGARLLEIRLNRSNTIAQNQMEADTANYYHWCGCNTIYYLSSGDYVEVRVWQNSGGNLNLLGGLPHTPQFWMYRIG